MFLFHHNKIKRHTAESERQRVSVSAIILAAGSSSRMGGGDKLAEKLLGRSVLSWTLLAFQRCELVDEIILVTRQGGEQSAYFACEGCDKIARVIHGGETRTASAYRGVMAASRTAQILLIHDGARPLVSDAVIRAAIQGAKDYGAALPATPVADTIKTEANGFVSGTPPRSSLYAAQTPQAFQAELIKAALTEAVKQGLSLTDDCAAVERLGMQVRLVAGDVTNRKITTRPDLCLAEALLRERGKKEQ